MKLKSTKRISVTGWKGGTTKTTTVLHLAREAAGQGFKVLVVDLDPQRNLTLSFLTDQEAQAMDDDSVFIDQVLKKRQFKALSTIVKGLDVIPSRQRLSSFMDGLGASNTRWDNLLDRVLEQAQGEYDLILIDTAATYSRSHYIAFQASDHYIIALRPEAYSLQGAIDSINEIEAWKTQEGFQKPMFLSYVLSGVPKGVRIAVDKTREVMTPTFGDRAFEISHHKAFDKARWEGVGIRSIYDLSGTSAVQKEWARTLKGTLRLVAENEKALNP